MKRIVTLITILATSAALSGCLFGKKEEAPAPAEVPPPAEAPMVDPAMPADGAAPTDAAAPTGAAPTEQAPAGH